jgi:putative ABC transport system permease protein
MEGILSDELAPRRFTSLLFALFAGLALALAAVGLYGVLSYGVSRRTVEIGIRAALGASRSDISTLVLGRGARLVATGIALGLAAGYAGARALSRLLFGIGAGDPATFASVAVFLLLVALVATYLPARRAARLDPLLALRSE